MHTSIHVSLPPYRQFVPVGMEAARKDARCGEVYALAVHRAAVAAGELYRLRLSVEREISWAPIILWIRTAPNPSSMMLSAKAGALGFRAAVVAETLSPRELRPVLTNPHGLGEQFVRWVRRRGICITPRVAEVLLHMFGREAFVDPAALGWQHVPFDSRTVRGWFAGTSRAGSIPLGPPTRWNQVARALSAALRLQREPRRPVSQVAVLEGYSEGPQLSRAFAELFDLNAGNVRAVMGWECLAYRWLQRTVLVDRRSPSGEGSPNSSSCRGPGD